MLYNRILRENSQDNAESYLQKEKPRNSFVPGIPECLTMCFPVPFPSCHKRKSVKTSFITTAYTVIPNFIVFLIRKIHNTSTTTNRHPLVTKIISVFHRKPPGGIVARLAECISDFPLPVRIGRHLRFREIILLHVFIFMLSNTCSFSFSIRLRFGYFAYDSCHPDAMNRKTNSRKKSVKCERPWKPYSQGTEKLFGI